MTVVAHTPIRVGRSFEDRPLLVLWETTRACELSCSHCRADAQQEPGPDDLTTSEARELIDGLAALGSPRPILILTGGDCLARRDLEAIVEHATGRRVPVAVSPSVTSKLSEATMHGLGRLGVRTASLSLDGATPRTHDSLRGVEGHFDETLRKIHMLKDCGFTVQVNTTVTNESLPELAKVAALLYRSHVDIWEVFFLISAGRGTALTAPSAAHNEQVCNFLVDASRYGITVRTVEAPFFRRVALERHEADEGGLGGLRDPGGTYVALRDELVELLGPPSSPMRTPSAATRDGKGVVFVASDGDVYPSGFLPLRLGTVRERPLVEIYRDDPVLRRIRRADFSGACGTCVYADLCGGSRARAFAAYGDPLAEDPGCVLAALDRGIPVT